MDCMTGAAEGCFIEWGERMKIPRVLTIAGSDSSGGAGIQADLKTFSALGTFGMSAITALTAQNTMGVRGVVEVDPDFVALQIRAVVTDVGVDAVKTGMLSSADIVWAVAWELRKLQVTNIVVDPVMVAKSGDTLLRKEAVESMISQLFPLATVVTPNLHEAAALVDFPVGDVAAMKRAAQKIKEYGPEFVVVKGGHLEGTPMDLLYDGKNFREFSNIRHETPHTHGTGCTFASAIAACLARGMNMEEALSLSKTYITGAIAKGLPLGRGHGPVHHFHQLYPLAGLDFELS